MQAAHQLVVSLHGALDIQRWRCINKEVKEYGSPSLLSIYFLLR